jgi:hypothetical protein
MPQLVEMVQRKNIEVKVNKNNQKPSEISGGFFDPYESYESYE